MLLIKLYANNCGYCTEMIPEWEKLKTLLDDSVQVIELEHIELMQKNNKLNDINKTLKIPIQNKGYPTIVKIQKKKPEYYVGPRLAKDMLKWVNKKIPNKHETKKRRNRKTKTRKMQKKVRFVM